MDAFPSFSKIRTWKPTGVLVQLFGLIIGENWRTETAIPFVRANLKDFLTRNFTDIQLLVLIESLRRLSQDLLAVDDSLPRLEDDDQDPESIMDSVVDFYSGMMSRGRGHKLLRELEDKVIRDGFSRNLLKLKVYPDVFPALRDWKRQGIYIYLDCPQFSNKDSILMIKSTTEGDLTPLVHMVVGNDKNFMASDFLESYTRVLTCIGVPKDQVLFVTQYGQRAKQMTDELGMNCLVVGRAENRKLRSYYIIRFPCVSDLREIQFIVKKDKTAY